MGLGFALMEQTVGPSIVGGLDTVVPDHGPSRRGVSHRSCLSKGHGIDIWVEMVDGNGHVRRLCRETQETFAVERKGSHLNEGRVLRVRSFGVGEW